MATSADIVPFNRPCVTGREVEYVSAAIGSSTLSGDGPFTRRCHDLLKTLTGAPHVLLTTSCTHALEMAAILAGIEPGDEVICPSFTFVSTINAFVLRGAIPVFVDVNDDTLNIDVRLVERAITPRTKVIVAVHYAGIACDLDALNEMASRRRVWLVEDNAHGLMGTYKGRPLGSVGRLATLSFHETKNISCGEGGALLINDDELAGRAEIIREKGTNRSRFFRGEIDKYTWVDVGSSYLPSDLLAAYLLAQLESAERIQLARRQRWDRYRAELAGWAARAGVRLPVVPDWCSQSYHLFYLRMPSLDDRTALIRHARERGVQCVFHYQPLHLSEMGVRYGGRAGDCPVTEAAADDLVRLPLYFNLTDAQQDRVIDAVTSFRPRT
jgi:dTDP-4-amino-4,6-dideoxygalactose transaminase